MLLLLVAFAFVEYEAASGWWIGFGAVFLCQVISKVLES